MEIVSSTDVSQAKQRAVHRHSRDAVLVAFLVLALGAEILFLCHNMKWIELPFLTQPTKKGEQIGVLTSKQSRVQGRHRGALSWQNLREGTPLHWNDTLLTGNNATAELSLENRAQLSLGPNSLLRLRPPQDSTAEAPLVFELNRGKVRIKSQNHPIKIKLKENTLVVEKNSAVELSQKTLAPRTSITVQSGQAQVIDKAGPAVVPKVGETFVLGQQREFASIPKHISLEELHPKNSAFLFAKQKKHKLTFQWKESEATSIELSKHSDFYPSRLIATEDPSVQLSPGTYYWRLIGEDGSSQSKTFEIVAPVHYTLTSPGKELRAPAKATLRWKTGTKTPTVQIELSRQRSFRKKLLSKPVRGTHFKLKGLTQGTYYWRIQGIHSSGHRFPLSKPATLKVLPSLNSPKLKGVRILPSESKIERPPRFASMGIGPLFAANLAATQGKKKPKKKTNKIRLEFRWEAVKEAKGYRLEVAHFPEMKKIIRAAKTKELTVLLELPKRSQYFWRVRPVDGAGKLGPPSAVHSIKIDLPKKKKKIATWTKTGGYGVRVGTRGDYALNTVTAEGYSISVSGLPLTQYWLKAFWNIGGSNWEAFLHYREDQFTPPTLLNGIQRHLNQSYVQGELLGRELVEVYRLPITFGLFFERAADLRKIAAEQVELKDLYRGGFLVGPTFDHNSSFGQWHTDAFLKFLPFGQSRGAFVSLRSRWETAPRYGDSTNRSPPRSPSPQTSDSQH